jgi:hypothetical protein
MALDIRANMAAIDGNKGANELFAVSCEVVSMRDRILRLCIEEALNELKEASTPESRAAVYLGRSVKRRAGK